MPKCVIQSEFAPNAAMKKRENMSTVLFVTPTIHPRLEDEPLGTLILATIVRQPGVDVDVYRFFDTWNISQALSIGTVP